MVDDLNRYFQETAAEIHFLDPVVGTKLSAHEPPPSLQQDPLMSRKFTHLAKLAVEKRITVQLLQSIHAGPEDFQDMVRDSGQVLFQAKIVGIEMGWKAHFDKNQDSTLSSVEYELAEGITRRAFQKEQLAWLRNNDKIIVTCEYPDTYESDLKYSYDTLLEACWSATRENDEQRTAILQGYFQFIRQWVFLGTLGY